MENTQSKSSIKKEQKKKEKELKRQFNVKEKETRHAEKLQKEQLENEQESETTKSNYGEKDYSEVFGNLENTAFRYVKIKDLDPTYHNNVITMRARISQTSTHGKSLVFIGLRQQHFRIQALAVERESLVSKQMIRFIRQLNEESIVDLEATVIYDPAKQIKKSTHPNLELSIKRLYVISKSKPLEISLEDLSLGSSESQAYSVPLSTRTNYKTLDLRVSAHQSIFQLQSQVTNIIYNRLVKEKFIEIHSPKLLKWNLDNWSSFSLNYFGETAHLATSNILYKQMAIASDFNRIFEIGPIYRKEHASTHRHLCEFTRIDIEMRIEEHYHELLDQIDQMFIEIFERLNKLPELLSLIGQQYPSESIVYGTPPLRIDYTDAVQMLKDLNEIGMGADDYLSTSQERRLGQLIKSTYGIDCYMIDRMPSDMSDVNAMPCVSNGNQRVQQNDRQYTNSFVYYIRGQEIAKGSQRIHDHNQLKLAINEQQIKYNLLRSQDEINCYLDFLGTLKYGCYPYAGCSIGLESLLMAYLGIPNIRTCSMYYRDCRTLNP
ncbi:hypothetical protein PPL_07128 [Heterostelium album PN500]|uniref:aspartate--tRNA ligase n=1 Tax=Heterostelium pallidum (strain ATCC 26659 / Pp 5 / PN500) TaxID=670386 RepID=D3BEG7_HETP5|nr:hypothetical protein PPL_07128 [Heterostelium album PN500]EFA80298.1 hypothetical protein PPL_07128 [Heterostelium album PN500]|eukprot:XP_020432418.1 hypothetical protein PPL_07128 [Heterostelium album PN500]